MSNLVTRGIILREVNYKEADKILTLLTPEGKLTAKARGVRRKGSRLAAGCQLLVYSELTLFEYKDYYTVNEAASLEQFWGVKQDVELLALGSYFAEVCEAVAEEGVPQPELLSLILNSLYALDKLGKPQALVKAAFELKTACLAGYEPLLDACAVCGAEPDQPAFHIREGVLHCAACRDEVGEGISMPLTPSAVAAMRHVAYGDPKRLFSFTLDPVSQGRMADACEVFLAAQLERGFYTLDFYKQIKL